ncbi:hypothetical protein MKK84_03110 [Methylobacterium sp. E-065]|uniref:DUF6894 family protein n=1 Tax=Methylobacterium sp. E-065 TaxID=2836583 RepID=UPI001FBBB4D6|nr:hypothetical protein [Methylobacterium sp. E-065]MCJ2016426.1 hypothetical protein [Methylobacterium sp. E-065]
MARYFFDVSNGSDVSDDVGLVFDDARSASQEALRSLPDMVKDQLLGSVGEKVSVTMRDDHGIPVYRATLTIEGEWLAGQP